MATFFSNLLYNVKKYKGLFCILVLSTIAISVLAAYSAINFDSVAITIDIGNVTFIKFLKGDAGFASLIFGTLLMLAIFYGIIFCCCSKKFLLPFAFIFYLYFVYSQIVILTSVILIYGFFNTLVLLFFLILFSALEFIILMLMILELLCCCGSRTYFKDCFRPSCNFVALSLVLLSLVVVFSLILVILKSFVILLVF